MASIRFLPNRNSIGTPSSGFVENIFDIDNMAVYLKTRIWEFGLIKIIQNGVRNLYFRNVGLKTQIINRFQKSCIRSVFLLSKFCGKNFFSKIQNGGFFEDDVSFEKKTLNSTFSSPQKELL
jgi:hypothetical protein